MIYHCLEIRNNNSKTSVCLVKEYTKKKKNDHNVMYSNERRREYVIFLFILALFFIKYVITDRHGHCLSCDSFCLFVLLINQ